MRRLVTGHASLKNVSGPVTIARVANASAKRGADWFLYFLALLSLSLAIINLLPIPALDGGHVLFLLVEVVTGRRPSDKFLERAQMAGLMILLALPGDALAQRVAQAGNAVLGEISFKDGKVQQDNFHMYEVARMSLAPKEVAVHLVTPPGNVPLGGVGEPGVPPIAPGCRR